jgi:hypothetical protein
VIVREEPSTIQDYRYVLPITTRWHDNDAYGHVNNVVYYTFFDTVVNTWLIENAGLDVHAAKFLDGEFARPATIAELAAAANTPALAAQAYTAARIAIEPNSMTEKAFLMNLAVALGLDEGLVAQIDAGAANAKA